MYHISYTLGAAYVPTQFTLEMKTLQGREFVSAWVFLNTVPLLLLNPAKVRQRRKQPVSLEMSYVKGVYSSSVLWWTWGNCIKKWFVIFFFFFFGCVYSPTKNWIEHKVGNYHMETIADWVTVIRLAKDQAFTAHLSQTINLDPREQTDMNSARLILWSL